MVSGKTFDLIVIGTGVAASTVAWHAIWLVGKLQSLIHVHLVVHGQVQSWAGGCKAGMEAWSLHFQYYHN